MFSIRSGFPKNDLLIEYPASSPSQKKCINLVKLCIRFVKQEKCLVPCGLIIIKNTVVVFTRSSVCLHLKFFSDFVSLVEKLNYDQACF